MPTTNTRSAESNVTSRYAAAAKAPEAALCCPVEYDKDLLKIIPQEVIEPLVPVKRDEARPWDSGRAYLRHPRETKGMDYNTSTAPSQCGDGGSCC